MTLIIVSLSNLMYFMPTSTTEARESRDREFKVWCGGQISNRERERDDALQ